MNRMNREGNWFSVGGIVMILETGWLGKMCGDHLAIGHVKLIWVYQNSLRK